MRTHRRRDGRDAGAVLRVRVRPCRLHRRGGGARRLTHGGTHSRGRRAAGAALDGAAHERIFAGAETAVRGGRLRSEDVAAGSREYGGGRASRGTPQLLTTDSSVDGGAAVAGRRAHYRR